LMQLFTSEALSRFAAEHDYSWLESYMERLEGKQERAHYYALVERSLSRK
jgi:TorA maturation chaperone TorD